jgi:hypothetical protein
MRWYFGRSSSRKATTCSRVHFVGIDIAER